MNVEYLDAYAKWQPLENATAVQVEPGVYEITIADLSPTWKVSKDRFDGSLLRVACAPRLSAPSTSGARRSAAGSFRPWTA
jgi:hypothetical protein